MLEIHTLRKKTPFLPPKEHRVHGGEREGKNASRMCEETGYSRTWVYKSIRKGFLSHPNHVRESFLDEVISGLI